MIFPFRLPYKFSLEVISPPTNLNRDITVQSQKPDLFWESEIKTVTYANPYVEFDIPLGAISTEVIALSLSGAVVHYKIYNAICLNRRNLLCCNTSRG